MVGAKRAAAKAATHAAPQGERSGTSLAERKPVNIEESRIAQGEDIGHGEEMGGEEDRG